MAKLDSIYIGKLPPGRAEDHERQLNSFRDAIAQRAIRGVSISGCDDCQVSLAKANKIYKIDKVPALPLKGCTRSPCCGCCYLGEP